MAIFVYDMINDEICAIFFRQTRVTVNRQVAMSSSLFDGCEHLEPIGSMYAIHGNIYHQYTPNVSIYTIHGSYGI